MARAFSTIALVGMLVVGLIIGGVGSYVYSTQSGSHLTTSLSTVTQTTTVLSTISQNSAISSSTTSSSISSNGLSLSSLELALSTSNASLKVTSYNFGKGTLAAWVENSGSAPIVLTASQCLFNGTFFQSTYLTALDPTVTQLGPYYYMPPNSTVVVQLTPLPTPLTGRNSTLSILNNVFTFTYGTSKD